MAMEIPMDLIKQVQTSLRQEAKVADYDPENPSLPNLHSFDDSITELDPSPADLRCSHCKERLLRGPQSLLCVFCGRRPFGDGDPTPPPIKFRYTVGYRWFLQSLGLDGSEFVQPATEAAKSNEGKNASRVEVQLSDLLDLEVQWHDETEIYGAREIFYQQKGLSSLVGVDVETHFPEGNSESFPPKKDVNVTEGNLSQDPEKLNALENIQTGGWADFQFSELRTPDDESTELNHIVGSSREFSSTTDEGLVPLGHSSVSHSNSGFEDDKLHNSSVSETPSALKVENDDDSFDTWNDFESSKVVENASVSSLKPTDKDVMFMEGNNRISFSDFGEGMLSQVSDSQHEKSVSSDQVVGSSFDLSVQMDEIFGFHEKGKDDNNSATNTNNWLVDDLLRNKSEEFGGAAGIKNGETEGNTDVSSSGKPDTTSIGEEDHPFDVWNDFKSSTSPPDGLKNPSQEISGTELKGEESRDPFSGWQSESQSVKSVIQHGESKPHEPFSEGSSSDLSTQMDAVFQPSLTGKNTTGSVSSSSNNWFQDDQWNDLSSRMTPQATQHDMSIDVKDSGKLGQERNISSVDWFVDDKWPKRGNNPPGIKTLVEDNDSGEAWHNFESSNAARDASMNSLKENGNILNFSELSFGTEHHGCEVKDVKVVEKADNFLMDFDWIQDDQQKIGSGKQPDPILGGNDDMSDEWNVYASSTNVQDTSSSSSKQGIDHVNDPLRAPDMNFFSMDHNPRKNDADSFSQQDLLFGTSGDQHVMLDRNNDAPQCSGNTEVEKDDLEALMLQMHDLSFMLESNLSVPPTTKQDGS